MSEENDIYTKDGTLDIHKKPASKAKTGSWKACRFILVTECCERLAYYGMGTNLVNYLTTCVGQGNVTASNNVTNWSGTCYITPLLGAFLADSYMGKYWTIPTFSTIYVTGMALLTLSASVPGLKPECHGDICHPTTTNGYLLHRAILDSTRDRWNKTVCILLWSRNIGAMIASSVLVWIQMNVGWGWGFGVPAVSMSIAVVFFFIGSPLYRLQLAGGSPVTRIFQVLVASMRKFNVKVQADKSLLYETDDKESTIQGSRKLEHTDTFRCLDKAAISPEADGESIHGASAQSLKSKNSNPLSASSPFGLPE